MVVEKILLEEYRTDNGKIPFREWLNALKDVTARMAIRMRLNRIQYTGNFGDHKSVGNGVYELRIAIGPGYRIYYAMHKKTAVLLLVGGHKGGQESDIVKAKKYWADYLSTNA